MMRIISGQLKGHRFDPPMGKWPTRPSTDRTREALYNILQNHFDFSELRVLDLFGGTGAHSFECISRGCKDVTYVERFRPAVTYVKKQIREWKLDACLTIQEMDVRKFLSKDQKVGYDFVFADPPYDLPWLSQIPGLIFENNRLSPGGVLVIEHRKSFSFEGSPGFTDSRQYGQTAFSFFHEDD